jgi:RNA polymerase sigma factor (sigma-70 family)
VSPREENGEALSVWPEPGVKAIGREKAEVTVKSLRDDLRECAVLRQRGDRQASERALYRAGIKMATLGKTLKRRFADRAERIFGRETPHLVEEAAEAARGLLYEDLMNLGPKKRFYEVTFNLCIKWRCIDAIRRVKVRNGMRANVTGDNEEEQQEDLEEQRRRIPDSLQALEDRAEEGQKVSLPEDEETRAAIERFFGLNLIKEVLARMPGHKYGEVLILHAIEQYTFEETAEMVGISERTARRYYKRAAEIVKRTVGDRK